MKHSKIFSLMFSALLCGSLLTGCGNTGSTQNDLPETPANVSQEAVFAGGTGTETDPYQIETIAQLEAFRDGVNDGSQNGYTGAFIQLGADLDMEGAVWTPIGTMEDMEGHSTMFLGVFDGDGHTVSNLSYTSEGPTVGAGLFGISCGTVKNLNMENVTVTVTDKTSMAIGGVIGYNMGSIDHVTLKGADITGNNCTGGIVGGNKGAVTNCRSEDVEVTVIGDNDFSAGLVQADIAECGGLIIGGGFGGTIDRCTASGTVRSEGNEPVGLGGIGGCLEMMDSITNCSATVTIESAKGGHAIGGLCGYAGTHSDPDVCLEEEGFSTTNYPSVIDNCSVQVTINAPGATHVGGLVGTGLYYFGEETAFAITNCRVEGSIDGTVTPGAIAGRAEGSSFSSCDFAVQIDGSLAENAIGTTVCMYESADQYDTSDNQAAAEQLLYDLKGTYQELWPVILSDEYDQVWLDNCATLVGEGNAEAAADMLASMVTGALTGEDAVTAYKEGGIAYCCEFLQGVEQFTFDGNTISGTDESGNEVFRHTYHATGEEDPRGFAIFESDDTNSGDFTYFALAPDTMDTTWHIEFRYGSDMDALNLYDAGKYAYWLASGISVDYTDQDAKNSIGLFCTENLSE